MKFTKKKHTLSALGQEKTKNSYWEMNIFKTWQTGSLTVNIGILSSTIKENSMSLSFLLFTMLLETSQCVYD